MKPSYISSYFSHCFLLVLFAVFAVTAQHANSHTVVPQADLKVITSGGFAAAFALLKPKFEQQYGVKITTSYGSSGGGAADSIPVRLANGETFDLIILSRSSLDALTAQGFVIPNSRTDLVRSDIAMAVKHGSAIPDISTEAALLILY